MSGTRRRPLSHRLSRRRLTRAGGVLFAIVAGHLGLLLVLNANAPKAPPQPPEPRNDFVVRFEQPRRPQPPPKRKLEEPPRLQAQAAPPSAPLARPAAPTPIGTPTLPVQPNYGRWTVAPSAAAPPSLATGLPGCTLATLSTLTGAARDACAKRLSEMARNAPALPARGYRPDQEEAAYGQALKSWKASTDMTPHPCRPDHEPAHKLYFDKCSLANAARTDTDALHQVPALKLEFKYKF